MAWYYGTFSCGHEGRVNVIGKESERQWKIDRAFSGLCEECKAKEREERFKRDMETAKEFEFPALDGTPKQIHWAVSIRSKFYDRCESMRIDADHIIQNETTARFWIDNRDMMDVQAFVNSYNRTLEKKQAKEQIHDEIVAMDVVKPPVIKYDGIVEIVETEGHICLKYENNPDFRKLVKSCRYKWIDKTWSRELSETVGTFEDRAAEIGHTLLLNGYCISIHDEGIKEKAVSGDYEREHTKWIYSRPDSPLLAIHWTGRDEALYERARKRLKSSKYDAPSIVIDVSHYKDVLAFAKDEDFKFTKKAQQKIRDYAARLESGKTVSLNSGNNNFVASETHTVG